MLILRRKAASRAAGVNNVPATPQVPGVDSVLSDTRVDYSANYITIPLILKYQVDRIGLGFGGQIGFLTSANDRFKGVVDSLRDLTLEANIKDRITTMDAGLVFSIDYAFRPELEMRSLRLNAKLYLGMMDIVDGNTGVDLHLLGGLLPVAVHAGRHHHGVVNVA